MLSTKNAQRWIIDCMRGGGETATIKDLTLYLGISPRRVRAILRILERKGWVRLFARRSWRRSVYELTAR